MIKEDNVFGKTANGPEYIALRERGTKILPGGIRDNEDNSQAIMCERLDNLERCSVRCIKKYLQKRNPNCPAMWQKPRNYGPGKFNESYPVWYCNVSLGPVIRATFSYNSSLNIVAFSVETLCCTYYRVRDQLVSEQT